MYNLRTVKYIVYQHVNLINGKSYVGYTSLSLEQRWNVKVKQAICYNSQTALARAIRKYGYDSLVWQHLILDVLFTLKGAKKAEKLWIIHLKTNLCKGGYDYNMTDGGDGVVGFKHKPETIVRMKISHKGKIKSLVHLHRLRISNLGKKRSLETCKKIGDSKRGAKHPFFGKNLSQQTREKMSMSQIKKEVLQLSKEGFLIARFDSLSDAQRKTNIPATNISKCCRKMLRTAGGFVWRYVNE